MGEGEVVGVSDGTIRKSDGGFLLLELTMVTLALGRTLPTIDNIMTAIYGMSRMILAPSPFTFYCYNIPRYIVTLAIMVLL